MRTAGLERGAVAIVDARAALYRSEKAEVSADQ
jgi:hypothetical protein